MPKKFNLIVVAHPDDETLFFGGLMLADRRYDWRVVCATDGNADGLGAERHDQFARACRIFGVRHLDFFDLPDRYDVRLSQNEMHDCLKRYCGREVPQAVFTHGPLGEYGHPHHQDVSLAVHEVFAERSRKSDVWGVAYNCAPDRIVELSNEQFKKKANVLAKVYFGETSRFIQHLPATSVEAFAQFKLREVQTLHQFFVGALEKPKLDKYRWFQPYLAAFRDSIIKRPF